MNNRLYKYNLAWVGIGLWGGLGAYRGAENYKKNYDIDYKRYLKNPDYNRKPQYYYLTYIGNSIYYSALYIYPISAPIFIIEELYNLEKAIRRIKDDSEE
jgi:hypothetical protein